MTKLQFLFALNDKLSGLPRDEVEQRLNFYTEIIEDRMEEGLSEAEAVAAVGSVEEIAEQITAEIPLAKIVTEKVKRSRKLKSWQIVLLAVGGLVWVPVLIAAGSVVISVYVSLWAVIVSLWACFVSLVASALAVAVYGVALAFSGNLKIGIAAIAAAIVCAGMSIFFFLGCKSATKYASWLTRKMALVIKKLFTGKESA